MRFDQPINDTYSFFIDSKVKDTNTGKHSYKESKSGLNLVQNRKSTYTSIHNNQPYPAVSTVFIPCYHASYRWSKQTRCVSKHTTSYHAWPSLILKR